MGCISHPSFFAWFNFPRGTVLELPSLEEDEARSPRAVHRLQRGYFYLPEEFDLPTDFVLLRGNLRRTRLQGRISVPPTFRFEIAPEHDIRYRVLDPFPGDEISFSFLANMRRGRRRARPYTRPPYGAMAGDERDAVVEEDNPGTDYCPSPEYAPGPSPGYAPGPSPGTRLPQSRVRTPAMRRLHWDSTLMAGRNETPAWTNLSPIPGSPSTPAAGYNKINGVIIPPEENRIVDSRVVVSIKTPGSPEFRRR
ncbi:hypothetical protein R1sor_003265 [Riccia sorocarpa]|uniref:Uncharacterized protein n=1 Tax=Riccia sorocarpa TaxID=122646 RepID=A0ABD3H1H8_9MARC